MGCNHDELEVVEYTEDRFANGIHSEVKYKGYACKVCGEPVPGDPDEDQAELEAEIELMRLLGK